MKLSKCCPARRKCVSNDVALRLADPRARHGFGDGAIVEGRQMKTEIIEVENGDRWLLFWCPGCATIHRPRIAGEGRPMWTWNGDRDTPTLSPSVVTWFGPMTTLPAGRLDAGKVYVCHLVLTEGRIRFLDDCTHTLTGQTVDLPDLEDQWRDLSRG